MVGTRGWLDVVKVPVNKLTGHPTNIQRREWILWLYDRMSECTEEAEAEAIIALIDHEETFLVPPPPKGAALDDIMMKPWEGRDA